MNSLTFQELNLAAPLLRAVAEAGYTRPSPIQEKAIPPVLAGRDLLGCAQTGTGKTAAFALPILQRLSAAVPAGRPVRALVLTPTRELALQIHDSFTAYGRHLPLRSAVIFGGVGQAPQVAALAAGVDVLTATPGRLNDLIGQGYVDLSRLEVFVLDEADRMLDMGFIHDVRRVLAHLPQKRQTLLFSATMPPEIEALAGSILHRPVKVMVTPPATTVERIRQSVCLVDKADKKHLLAYLLKAMNVESALVFTRTKHGADRVVRELARAGITAMAIHGNKSQTARQRALGAFRDGRLKVLVATDIAARGIDVDGLSHVFNYDLPNVPETYVHRIGRTGRAGRDGVAVSFCCADEQAYLRDIEKLTRQAIPLRSHPWAPGAPAVPDAGPSTQQPKETMTMEQTKQAPAPAASGGEAQGQGRKRRRHRGGAGRRGTRRQEAAPAAQAPAQQDAAPARQPARAPKAPKPARQEAPRPEARPARARGQEKTSQRAARPEQPAKAARPAREPGLPRPDRLQARRDSIRAEFSAEDNSIQLITRRPPAAKFSSFEEYMKAHGLSGGEEGAGAKDGKTE